MMQIVAPIFLVLLLQSQAPSTQSIDLPVSLDRIRAGLATAGLFDPPPPRPWRLPIFRIRVEQWQLEGNPWDENSFAPVWVQPSTPPLQFQFLQSVTPDEVRSPSVHPCCDVMPAVTAARSLVTKGVRAVKQARARREVEQAMRAAGIRR